MTLRPNRGKRETMFSGSGSDLKSSGSTSGEVTGSMTRLEKPGESAGASSAGSSGASAKTVGTLTLDKAAFLLIRIKRAFRKKRKDKSHVTAKQPTVVKKTKPPLLRAKTLPAIIVPSLNILQAQLDSGNTTPTSEQPMPSERSFKERYSSSTKQLTEKHGKISKKTVSHKSKCSQNSHLKFCLLVDEDDISTGTKSPTLSPRHSVSSTSSTGSTHGKDSSTSTKKNAGFAKLARLLTQPKEKGEKLSPTVVPNSDSAFDVSCFAWNKGAVGGTGPGAGGAGTSLIKSGSVDSLLGIQFASNHGINISVTEPEGSNSKTILTLPPGALLAVPSKHYTAAPNSPQAGDVQKSKSGVFIPSSPSIHNRLAKTIAGKRQGSIDFLLPEGMSLTKAEKKRLERLNKFNFDLQALFSAVEHQQLDRAKSLLENTDVDVNSANSDGFAPLDIAVMTLNIPMVRLLQSCGAKESTAFTPMKSRETQLSNLLKEAERSVQDLTAFVSSSPANGSLGAALLKEKERQLTFWERRLILLKRMQNGFDHIKPPDAPPRVQLEVVGTRSLKVKFREPKSFNETSLMVTKYRVEWSFEESFDSVVGSSEVTDLNKLELIIGELRSGKSYSVRVSAGNVKGFSQHCVSRPPSATPSSWRDFNDKATRAEGNLRRLDDLFLQIIDSRPKHAAEVKVLSSEWESSQHQPHQRRGQMRKSIKYLFAPTPKFQKTMKRGVYLAALLFNEDRVLVTTDDTLPIIGVDDTYPSGSLHTDFHWMLKVACTWDDVKTFRTELEKSQSSSSAHLRSKMLHAVEQLQTALGSQDLGQLYYQPLKDSEGTILICSVKQVADPKSVSSLSVRWLPLAKLQKKVSISNSSPENSDSSVGLPVIGDLLLSSLQEMMIYNKASRAPLPRGLYLGYVKLKSSVDLIRVLVTKSNPNILPHARIRENPHVSREEWEWLRGCWQDRDREGKSQSKFLRSLVAAVRSMERCLGLESLDAHRIYDAEVIELSQDVSFIFLLPPVESVCSVPGQTDQFTEDDDFIHLPVQIFEMIHMNTYQPAFISRYSRISSILEMDTMVAQHALREAFSSHEVASAKSRLQELQQFQVEVDESWRTMRWIMDVINFARDKQANGISLSAILANVTPSAEDLDEPDSPRVVVPSICFSSPQQLQVPSKEYSSQRRTSRDDSTLGLSTTSTCSHLKISHLTTSASTYSLLDMMNSQDTSNSVQNLTQHLEIRRCVSTSRLVHGTAPNSVDSSDRDESRREDKTLSPQSSCDNINSQMRSKSFDQSEFPKFTKSGFLNATKSLSYVRQPETIECRQTIESQHSGITPSVSQTSFDSTGSDTVKVYEGIFRVFAAYNTGVSKGTSIKLQVSEETVAKEVVELVVKQFNMIIKLKGLTGPIYGGDQLVNFCLVSAKDGEELVIEDASKILELDNKWKSGKFYVREKCSDLYSGY